eukprot:7919_1
MSLISRAKQSAKYYYELWKYGFDHPYRIYNPEGLSTGVTDVMGSGAFSFHNIGGGESAREHVTGGWSIDWTLHEEYEPDAEHSAVDSYDVRKYTKWQYMTIREKKSIDPSVFRDWYHPTRPPVITTGIGPQQEKRCWEQQQLVLYRRWAMQGLPPKPGQAYHMHNLRHGDHGEDWYWPYANYDEFMVALNKARYLKSRSGQRQHKKHHEQRMRRQEMNAPQV